MKTETLDQLAALGNRTTGAGASIGVLGVITSSQFVGLAGVVIALIGVLVNWYYKDKASRRADKEHDLKMEMMRERHRVSEFATPGEDC